ncbi:GH116 family glycosyl hydrolase [Arenibacter sp. ARW7G5Y1]|uniref:GH116 family glycosyl hydrolase n=1 Tax=Arenibacter sp. ARW7G5Y1 TaxID=2135619 RepID=UPI000D94F491|nr:GH116 family glycosyl hydrolase [Arenibacter sp. ARW7G5Y1]PXX25490.1 uncharacterized protein (DUF608 family) [Arenibacter sp. ARW7G5Y1]
MVDNREFNDVYKGRHLSKIAFPIGGIGAGMFCMEGTGAISHMSINHKPDVYNEPCVFAALHIKGKKNISKVLEGPVPDWKKHGQTGGPRSSTAIGAGDNNFGLPRFDYACFKARFPYGTIQLSDSDVSMDIQINGWSPFIPTNSDDSSLPVGALEYSFENKSEDKIESVFSWNSKNFLKKGGNNRITKIVNGFVLEQGYFDECTPNNLSQFAAYIPNEKVTLDCCWFRGSWNDPLYTAWNKIENGNTSRTDPVSSDAPGASIYLPFTLKPGEKKVIKVLFCWYTPNSDLRIGKGIICEPNSSCSESKTYRPWYVNKFKSIGQLVGYWKDNYDRLNNDSFKFTEAFYKSTLPSEVLEAVSANLGILKSPTVLRQTDGKLWAYEGCDDTIGCCPGSCSHVWNYAQALPHLFPDLERTLRETEFNLSQNEKGHQTFRTSLPIGKIDYEYEEASDGRFSKVNHNFHAAADGQLGGIMKVYRDWRISGDTNWMILLYPRIKSSLDYCIATWDPKRKGILEEPHHNTYDIEFWGPNGMTMSFYLGALTAIIEMGKVANESVQEYRVLLKKGKEFMETNLYEGEYFIQKIVWKGLVAQNPIELSKNSWKTNYSVEAKALLEKEGPKYQYGQGCLSDGIVGMWMASCCGLEEVIDGKMVMSHLRSVYTYNLLKDMRNHSNPQRPSYALGAEGGLILCSWPKGGKLKLPFVYSNEVWTGIEYQVASHLIMNGMVEEGLEIVRTCRKRYDGTVRNPFDEYECGHWYARAMASYSLIQGLTGVRYDAYEKTLYIDSKIGEDFTSFLSTRTGFGNISLKDGEPAINIVYGHIEITRFSISGKIIKV